LAKTCAAIVHSCEQVHDLVFRTQGDNGLQYFWFRVDHGLAAVDVMEWNEAGSEGNLTHATQVYMGWAKVSDHFNLCVHMLNGEKHGKPFLPLPQ
jgi:hypothetical protein